MTRHDASFDPADFRPRPAPLPSSEQGLWEAIRQRAVWWDVLLLAVVPVALLAGYALPPAIKWTLAFDYTEPTLLAAYASYFVHFSQSHLLGNLLGYLLVVPTAYVLSVASDQRHQFLVVFTVFLLAFPFALSGLNLAIPRSHTAVGFSAIIMAFVGYLPIGLLGVTEQRFSAPLTQRQSHWVFFFGLALVGYLGAPGVLGRALAAAAVLAGVLFLLPVLEEFDQPRWAGIRAMLAREGDAELLLLGGVVFVAYPFVAFPSDATVSGGLVNLYAHALGFCLGYITTYVTVLVGGFDE